MVRCFHGLIDMASYTGDDHTREDSGKAERGRIYSPNRKPLNSPLLSISQGLIGCPSGT